MKNYIYGMNNSRGVKIKGIDKSVYKLIKTFKNIEILEEKDIVDDSKNSLRFLDSVKDSNEKVFLKSNKIIKCGKKPILFAGDHAISIGSVSASSNNYENLGLIWIDAHADINTVETSISGNIHGMPVSFLLGMGDESLSKIGGYKPKIKPENIFYLGLRDLDPGEINIIKKLNIRYFTSKDIKSLGTVTIVNELIKHFSNINYLHLSFDLDVIDPSIFPAVSTPVADGLSLSQIKNILKAILATNKVINFDFVEFNASKDIDDKCLTIVNDLIKMVDDLL